MSAATNTAPPGVHLVFADTTPESVAVERYRQRFGVEPQIIVKVNRQLWLGPVPDQKKLPIATR